MRLCAAALPRRLPRWARSSSLLRPCHFRPAPCTRTRASRSIGDAEDLVERGHPCAHLSDAVLQQRRAPRVTMDLVRLGALFDGGDDVWRHGQELEDAE